MANREMMSYLTAPLREVAQHHLQPDETLLTAIYVHHTISFARDRWLWLTWYRQDHHPTRAFILTTERALIVEDPTDPTTSTGSRDYLFASCSLNPIMLFELRSNLLDCALTLVMATPNGPKRVTIEYNGVSENAFLAAVVCIRALVDGQPLPFSTWPDETYAQKRMIAYKGWHAVLADLGMKLENAVVRYLASDEQVQEWLSVPTIDESMWWQRLSIGAHEQPPAVLVRTDRQILLVKEMRRTLRGQTTRGSKAWLMPLERLRAVSVVSDKRELEMQFTLEHVGAIEVVHLPVLPELAERALALVMPSLATRGR
ncbi:MAG TPA: hypothetical protein VEL31_18370 [Ktedonobacteraceae bacterium]|nr:hypothetical protein [Ktedonobacteraceae bacterium]